MSVRDASGNPTPTALPGAWPCGLLLAVALALAMWGVIVGLAWLLA